MNHADIIRNSATNINDLVNKFGPRELVFDRAAKLASILLNQEVTTYEVAMIVTALNLGHLQDNRSDSHNYVSAVVNLAFSAQFATQEKKDENDELFAGIQEIAKKFSPPRPQDNLTPMSVSSTEVNFNAGKEENKD